MLPKNDIDTGVTIGKLLVGADFTHIFCITPTATGIKIEPDQDGRMIATGKNRAKLNRAKYSDLP